MAIGLDKLRVIEGVFRKHLDEPQAALNRPASNGRSSYAISDGGVAVIPVQGTLVQRSSGLDAESGLTSYARIGAEMRDALANAQVRAILMEIDSPGGEVAGLFDLADAIYQARDVKPVWAIANENAYSAAYAIASAAERIFLPRSAGVGSIGVVAMHMDQSAKDAKQGYVYTPVFAGTRKIDGSEHFPLSDEARASLQAEVDRLYGLFVSTVARNRNIDVGAVRATEAGWLNPQEAVAGGFADGIATFSDTLAELERRAAPPNGIVDARAAAHRVSTTRKRQMDDLENTVAEAPDKTHDTPVADVRPVNEDALREEGRQEGKTAERERIAAILDAPEAEGRADLARSLATETDLDAESALRVLSSAPEQAKGGAALSAAMATVQNPVVGADDPETQEDAAVEAMTARALSSLGHNSKKGA
ncbi:MAG: S49 family peptidase [Rhodospirillaceae bacterium]|nr:S49 family peptidase [Rhodospirillaceae bacterium]